MLEEIAKKYSDHVKKHYFSFSKDKNWEFSYLKTSNSYVFGLKERKKPFFTLSKLFNTDIYTIKYDFLFKEDEKEFYFLDRHKLVVSSFPSFLKKHGYDVVVNVKRGGVSLESLLSTGKKSESVLKAFLFVKENLNLRFIFSSDFSAKIARFGINGANFQFVLKDNSLIIMQRLPIKNEFANIKNLEQARTFVSSIEEEEYKMKEAEKEILKELDTLKILYQLNEKSGKLFLLGQEINFKIYNQGAFYTFSFQSQTFNEGALGDIVKKGRSCASAFGKKNRLKATINGKNTREDEKHVN